MRDGLRTKQDGGSCELEKKSLEILALPHTVFEVDMLGSQFESVDFGAGDSPISQNRRDQID